MREIKNKVYKTNGILMVKDGIYPNVPMLVTVTNDKIGCTVSISCEAADIQFTVPFDRMLKDLKD